MAAELEETRSAGGGQLDELDAEALPYLIHLPGFDGPLDLLLHLIEKNQLEITSISLVAVTDQFVHYIRTWEAPPIARMAEFVAMAARLLLIKSRSLLPRQPKHDDSADETDPLDDAEQLARHLLEYKLAREIARALKDRELAGLHSFARPGRLQVDPEEILNWSPPKLVGLNVNALALVFKRVLTEKKFSEPEQLPLPLVTVAEMMAEVERRLQERTYIRLEDMLDVATSRFAVVVTFLAVLEMWHQARLVIQQESLFGPVEIARGPRFEEALGRHSLIAEFDPPGASLPSAQAESPGEPAPRRTRARRQRGEPQPPAGPADAAE